MAITTIDGVDLYYEIHGSGEPLFLTHGSWGDATAWKAVLEDLSERFEVILWDRRGHSRSADGADGGALGRDAADLAGLIEELERGPAYVYGTSSGGTIVLGLVADRPDLVVAAAVHEPAVTGLLDSPSEPTPGDLADQRRHLDRVHEMIEAGRGRAAAGYFIDHVALGPGSWARLPEETKAVFAANASTYAEEIASMESWTVDAGALAETGVPTLITVGTESPALIRASTHELIRRLPSAAAMTLDGVGHSPYRTHPDMWLETVDSFFRSSTSRSAT